VVRNSVPAMKVEQNPITYSVLKDFSDEVLMAYVAAANHDALAVLFDRYQGAVFRVAMQVLRNPHEAEDLLQVVFLELMRNAGKFDAGKGTARVWILQCVYHRAFDRKRYLNRRGAYDVIDNETSLNGPAEERNEASTLSAMDSARLVQQAMAHLSEAQRKTIEMAFFDGLTMHEIADKTGETFANVRHHYYRGLEKMRAVLGTHSKDRDRTVGGETAYVRP
jgi:RNA polymerase sigma-70 factor (ECF subfamily)